jgi:hypothetical protein
MRKIVWFVVLAATAALAQQPGADAPATREDVLQLFTLMNINQQMRSIMDSMMEQQKNLIHQTARQKNPKISAQDLARIDRMMDETVKNFPISGLLDDMVPVYQKHLSKADVSAMSTFYSSRTGQKLLREMPAMTSEAMQASYGRLQTEIEAITERVDKAIREDQQRRPAPKAEPGRSPQSLQN